MGERVTAECAAPALAYLGGFPSGAKTLDIAKALGISKTTLQRWLTSLTELGLAGYTARHANKLGLWYATQHKETAMAAFNAALAEGRSKSAELKKRKKREANAKRVRVKVGRPEVSGAWRIGMELLTKRGSVGANSHDLARLASIDVRPASNAFCRLELLGKITSRRETEYAPNGKRYYLPEFAPVGESARTEKPRGRPVAKKREPTVLAHKVKSVTLRLDPSAPAIVPADVKVTIAPPFRDTRFVFDPPPGWRGEITTDWLDRRLGAACRERWKARQA